jgi:hypothetical protein
VRVQHEVEVACGEEEVTCGGGEELGLESHGDGEDLRLLQSCPHGKELGQESDGGDEELGQESDGGDEELG